MHYSGLQMLNPYRCLSLLQAECEIRDKTEYEKKLESLISLSGKYETGYVNMIIVSLIAAMSGYIGLWSIVVNGIRISLLEFFYPLIVPAFLYLIGLLLLGVSKLVDKKIERLRKSNIVVA